MHEFIHTYVHTYIHTYIYCGASDTSHFDEENPIVLQYWSEL